MYIECLRGTLCAWGLGHDGGMDSGIPWRTKSSVALSAMPRMVPKAGSLLGSRGQAVGEQVEWELESVRGEG